MNLASLANFSVEKAHKTQLAMSKRILFEDKLPKRIRHVAGIDVAYARDFSIGAAAVLDYKTHELVESQTAISKTLFPYIPTLLSFREIPPAIQSIRKLLARPDVFLVDGQGFAHPYHCGFASHLGLVLNKPTIGVAKSRLFGMVEDGKNRKVAYLKHNGEVIGAAVKPKENYKPLYVSVGHMVSLEKAIRIVERCSLNQRVPEPIIIAHKIATEEKGKLNISLTNINNNDLRAPEK
jgi:deoxyribonuclease V